MLPIKLVLGPTLKKDYPPQVHLRRSHTGPDQADGALGRALLWALQQRKCGLRRHSECFWVPARPCRASSGPNSPQAQQSPGLPCSQQSTWKRWHTCQSTRVLQRDHHYRTAPDSYASAGKERSPKIWEMLRSSLSIKTKVKDVTAATTMESLSSVLLESCLPKSHWRDSKLWRRKSILNPSVAFVQAGPPSTWSSPPEKPLEKCREQRQLLFLAFTDLTKAFNLISRDGLFKILATIGCPPSLLSITRSFHDNMKGTVVWNDFRTGPYFIMHTRQINYAFALLFSRTIRMPKGIEYIHG